MVCSGYELVGSVAVRQVNDDLVPREARARWGDDAVAAFALVSNLFRTMKHARKLNIHGQTYNIKNNMSGHPETIIMYMHIAYHEEYLLTLTSVIINCNTCNKTR